MPLPSSTTSRPLTAKAADSPKINLSNGGRKRYVVIKGKGSGFTGTRKILQLSNKPMVQTPQLTPSGTKVQNLVTTKTDHVIEQPVKSQESGSLESKVIVCQGQDEAEVSSKKASVVTLSKEQFNAVLGAIKTVTGQESRLEDLVSSTFQSQNTQETLNEENQNHNSHIIQHSKEDASSSHSLKRGSTERISSQPKKLKMINGKTLFSACDSGTSSSHSKDACVSQVSQGAIDSKPKKPSPIRALHLESTFNLPLTPTQDVQSPCLVTSAASNDDYTQKSQSPRSGMNTPTFFVAESSESAETIARRALSGEPQPNVFQFPSTCSSLAQSNDIPVNSSPTLRLSSTSSPIMMLPTDLSTPVSQVPRRSQEAKSRKEAISSARVSQAVAKMLQGKVSKVVKIGPGGTPSSLTQAIIINQSRASVTKTRTTRTSSSQGSEYITPVTTKRPVASSPNVTPTAAHPTSTPKSAIQPSASNIVNLGPLFASPPGHLVKTLSQKASQLNHSNNVSVVSPLVLCKPVPAKDLVSCGSQVTTSTEVTQSLDSPLSDTFSGFKTPQSQIRSVTPTILSSDGSEVVVTPGTFFQSTPSVGPTRFLIGQSSAFQAVGQTNLHVRYVRCSGMTE